MKFKIHYKTRDRIFDKFGLWPFVHFLAKRRYKKNPNDPKAIKWLQVTEDNLERKKTVSQSKSVQSFEIRDYIEGLNRIEKYNYDIIRFERLIDKVDSPQTLKAILYSALGKIKFENLDDNTDVKCLEFYINYILYSKCLNNNLKASIELKKLLQTEGIKSLNSVKILDFYNINKNGVEKLKEAIDEISQNKNTKRKEIIVISETANALYNAIPSLPDNSNISAYYFNADKLESLESDKLNLKIEIKNFYDDLVGLDSKANLEAVDIASKIADNIGDIIFAETKSFTEFDNLEVILPSLKLQIEDSILGFVKKIVAIEHLTRESEDFYIILDDRNTTLDILHYLSLKQLTLSKNLNVNFTKYSDRTNRKYSLAQISKLYRDEILPSLNGETKLTKLTSQTAANESLKGFKNILKDAKPLATKNNYILSYLNTADPNYKRAAQIISKKIFESGKNHLLLTHNANTESLAKYLSSNLDNANTKKFDNSVECLDISPRSITKQNNKQDPAWKDYIFEKIIVDLLNFKTLEYNDIDVSYIFEDKIKNAVNVFLPTALLLAESINKMLIKNKPETVIFSPGRNYFAWLLNDISKKHGLITRDLQVLFQSAYSRYKPSKADIFGMINNEQINIYKNIFKLEKGQRIIKVGSLLLSEKLNAYNEIDPEQIKANLQIDDDKKVIVFATQYLNLNDCLESLDEIMNNLKDKKGYCLIIKTHPKEKAYSTQR